MIDGKQFYTMKSFNTQIRVKLNEKFQQKFQEYKSFSKTFSTKVQLHVPAKMSSFAHKINTNVNKSKCRTSAVNRCFKIYPFKQEEENLRKTNKQTKTKNNDKMNSEA